MPATDRSAALRDDAALPLLPLLYAAWADGELTAAEIAAIGDSAEWLPTASREAVSAWLDADAAPSAVELLRLRRAVREAAASLDDPTDLTLAELGVALARQAEVADDLEQIREALETIDARLGFVGTEATRDVLAAPVAGGPVAEPLARPAFDVEAMQSILDGPFAEQKRRVRTIIGAEPFEHRHETDTATERQQVGEWLRVLTDAGLGELAFPGVTTERAPGAFFAAFEALAAFDLSLLTKFGVQFGLFGGSIYHLGTEEQRRQWLPAVATLELPGCFAMSELGHGSNVRDLETVARFDAASDEFVIDTPSESARKDWIGNAALHGHMATVFAQLQIGEDGHGVHAFLVPLRDGDGTTLPGVTIQDCGRKLGLNGVDNGRIWFDGVRIPRAHLLARFGSVSAEGEYTSPIPSAGRRFFTMLRTLVGGRIAVASAGVAAARSALTIAVRYTSRRRQFGPPGRPEVPILGYQVQQLRLMPLLASAYAYGFAVQRLVDRYGDEGDSTSSEVEALAAAVKAQATWSATRTIQTCRESCGGQGYLAVNRFAALKADSEIFTTYEGDNTILLQLVAKGLLARFRAQFGDNKLYGAARHLASQAATAVAELNPVTTRLRSEEHLRDPEFQLSAFRYRETRLVVSLARRLQHRIDAGIEPFDALNECQDHALAAATAYAQRAVLESFNEVLARATTVSLRTELERLRDLFALSDMHEDPWFLLAGTVEPSKAKAIRNLVERLCGEVAGSALDLVEAFGIPDNCLGAPIGLGHDSG